MLVRWYGQSAFLVEGSKTVLLDPFGPVHEAFAGRGLECVQALDLCRSELDAVSGGVLLDA